VRHEITALQSPRIDRLFWSKSGWTSAIDISDNSICAPLRKQSGGLDEIIGTSNFPRHSRASGRGVLPAQKVTTDSLNINESDADYRSPTGYISQYRGFSHLFATRCGPLQIGFSGLKCLKLSGFGPFPFSSEGCLRNRRLEVRVLSGVLTYGKPLHLLPAMAARCRVAVG